MTLALMTLRLTPQARPSADFDGTKTYGTFLSSHRSGKCSRISMGSVSAAMTINSEIPLFRVFVAIQIRTGTKKKRIGRTFVGTLSKLLHMSRLLNQIQDLLRKSGISERESFWVRGGHGDIIC